MINFDDMALPFAMGVLVGFCGQKINYDKASANDRRAKISNCRIEAHLGMVQYQPDLSSTVVPKIQRRDSFAEGNHHPLELPEQNNAAGAKKNEKKKKKKKKAKHEPPKDPHVKSPKLSLPTTSKEFEFSEAEVADGNYDPSIVNDEIAVLKSIYMDELVVNRYQSKLYNGELTVKLEVVHRRVIICKVRILVRYTKEYPRTAPVIEIIESERLPEEELEKLQEIIDEEITRHLRRKEQVVFNLCQRILDFLNVFAEPRKKNIYKVDMNSTTMWDKREEENKTKELVEMQIKETEKELLKKQTEEEELLRQLSIQKELEMRKSVENRGVLVSEKAQEYQQYLISQKDHLLGDDDMRLLRDHHSDETSEEASSPDDVETPVVENRRKISFKSEESDAFEKEKLRKMTTESGRLDSATKSTKESRFNQDYEIKGKLGEGGGGSVYLAKNKIDENLYAIKKIKLDPSISKKVMKEVRFLSKISHKNIVRYYQAWTEDVNPIHDSEDEEEEDEEEEDNVKRKLDTSQSNVSKSNQDDDDLRYDHTNMGKGYGDDEESYVAFEKVERSENEFFKFADDDDDESKNTSEAPSEDEMAASKRHKKSKQNYLLIQMEYCDSESLRSFIDSGKLDSENRVKLIKQIFEALKYLHDNGIIHRDLKPANIFLNKKMEIKMGDFGLATVISKKKDDQAPSGADKLTRVHSAIKSVLSNLSMGHEESISKTVGIGTGHYRSPELRSSGRYDQKTDLYSMGVIIFEMCYPFATGMEREECLRRLTQFSVFPDDFEQKCGTDAEFMKKTIKSLLVVNPVQRPTSTTMYDIFWRQYYRLLNESFEDKLGLLNLFFMKKNSITELLSFPNGKIEPITIDVKHVKSVYFLYDHMEKLFYELFKRHDGVKIQVDEIIPFRTDLAIDRFYPAKIGNDSMYDKRQQILLHAINEENSYLFLNKEGIILQSPLDNFHYLARFAAKSSFDVLRVYNFCDHHKGTPNKDMNYFIKNLEASFSIVYPTVNRDDSPRPNMSANFDIIYETEIFFMVLEIIQQMKLKSSLKIRLSHTAILDYIIEELKVPDHKVQSFLEMLTFSNDLFNKTSVIEEKLRNLELTNCPVHKIFELLLISAPDKDQIVDRLKKNSNRVPPYLTKLLDDLFSLIKMTKELLTGSKEVELDLPIEICFSCVSSGFIFHSGLYFQVVSVETHLNAQKKPFTKMEKLIEGGRFDNLIRNYTLTSSRVEHKGLGIRFLCTNLLPVFGLKFDDNPLHSAVTHADILISSKGDSKWFEMLRLCSEFWLHDLKASYLVNANQSLDNLTRLCKKNKIKVLVFLKEGGQAKAKVCDIVRNVESEESSDKISEAVARILNPGKALLKKDLRGLTG